MSHELDLLEKAQLGDERAFRSLIDSASGSMWAVTLSITGNRHDAEDAMQNALISIWRNIHRFDPRAKFSTWAYRIAANAALQLLRKKRDTPQDDIGLDQVDSATGVQEHVTAAMVIRTALQTLPLEFKEALVLREYAGFSYQDIATHQQVSLNTVKSRLNRARAKLSEALTEAGVTLD